MLCQSQFSMVLLVPVPVFQWLPYHALSESAQHGSIGSCSCLPMVFCGWPVGWRGVLYGVLCFISGCLFLSPTSAAVCLPWSRHFYLGLAVVQTLLVLFLALGGATWWRSPSFWGLDWEYWLSGPC